MWDPTAESGSEEDPEGAGQMAALGCENRSLQRPRTCKVADASDHQPERIDRLIPLKGRRCNGNGTKNGNGDL